MEHIEGCHQTEIIKCPVSESLHGEEIGEHWWSGWPGAHCMKCGSEDKNELCIGTGCPCECHEQFWKDYEENMRKK